MPAPPMPLKKRVDGIEGDFLDEDRIVLVVVVVVDEGARKVLPAPPRPQRM